MAGNQDRQGIPALNSRRSPTPGRIVVEDSTTLRLPKGNAEEFPGHGNASGDTAGCKVDLAFDLLGGDILHSELHHATDSNSPQAHSLAVGY